MKAGGREKGKKNEGREGGGRGRRRERQREEKLSVYQCLPYI